MIKEKVIIKNEIGLHARPATLFVNVADQYQSDVKIIKDGMEVNGKSILSLLALAAEKGSEVILIVDGKDEKEAFKELKSVLEGTYEKK